MNKKDEGEGFPSVIKKVKETKYNPRNDPYAIEFKKLLKDIFNRK